jgi:hypothetical protein
MTGASALIDVATSAALDTTALTAKEDAVSARTVAAPDELGAIAHTDAVVAEIESSPSTTGLIRQVDAVSEKVVLVPSEETTSGTEVASSAVIVATPAEDPVARVNVDNSEKVVATPSEGARSIPAATAVVAETEERPLAEPDALASAALSEMKVADPSDATLIEAAIAVVAFSAAPPVTVGDTRASVDRSA